VQCSGRRVAAASSDWAAACDPCSCVRERNEGKRRRENDAWVPPRSEIRKKRKQNRGERSAGFGLANGRLGRRCMGFLFFF
jgi:hypothetical protein